MNDITYRVENPLYYTCADLPNGGLKARHLDCTLCAKSHAVSLVKAWHSRLPNTQDGPWQYAFKMEYMGITYAVALWNNPSARTLPGHWLELRRMACAPDAPKYTASRFLSLMVKWFQKNTPEREKCISYQDTDVHQGTIYKAANWIPEYESKPRIRDRSKPRSGTNRMYRSSINGVEADASAKVRWAICLTKSQKAPEIASGESAVHDSIYTPMSLFDLATA